MSIAEKFCWEKIDDEQFEELVFAVLKSANPQQIQWRKGPGDKGRDIQVQFRRQGGIGEEIDETYFVEVKHYQGGVSSRSQLRLQIAIRDYLFILNSDISADKMDSFVQKIKESVELVRQVGDAAYHID